MWPGFLKDPHTKVLEFKKGREEGGKDDTPDKAGKNGSRGE